MILFPEGHFPVALSPFVIWCTTALILLPSLAHSLLSFHRLLCFTFLPLFFLWGGHLILFFLHYYRLHLLKSIGCKLYACFVSVFGSLIASLSIFACSARGAIAEVLCMLPGVVSCRECTCLGLGLWMFSHSYFILLSWHMLRGPGRPFAGCLFSGLKLPILFCLAFSFNKAFIDAPPQFAVCYSFHTTES